MSSIMIHMVLCLCTICTSTLFVQEHDRTRCVIRASSTAAPKTQGWRSGSDPCCSQLCYNSQTCPGQIATALAPLTITSSCVRRCARAQFEKLWCQHAQRDVYLRQVEVHATRCSGLAAATLHGTTNSTTSMRRVQGIHPMRYVNFSPSARLVPARTCWCLLNSIARRWTVGGV